MAKKGKPEKQAANLPPVFFRDVSTVKQYRDEKGRFISKEKASEIGVAPVFKTVTKYRDKKGRIVSEQKVKRAKKKIVDRAKVKGKLKELKPEKIGKKVKSGKGEIQYQEEYWQSIRTNFEKDIMTKTTAVKANGRLYILDKKEVMTAGDFLTRVNYLILNLFKEIGESPSAFILTAFSKDKVVYDFDTLQIPEKLQELRDEEEDINEALNVFNSELKKIKNQYFKK